MAVKTKKKKTAAAAELQKITAVELPEEVLHREILTRLPIKSVVRFKSVSKTWLSLFSNPQFVKQHHTCTTTQNPHDYDRLVADKRTKMVILSRYKETIVFPSDRSYFMVGSVNGLVCMRRHMNLSLWNPAIHQSKEFKIPTRCFRWNEMFIGLGFDPESDSFKVVGVSGDLRFAIVYCSGLDSWYDVEIPDNVFRKNGGEKVTQMITIKGSPYWICQRLKSLSAVKFNVKTNEFSRSPELHINCVSNMSNYRFVNVNDRLNLIVYHRLHVHCVLDVYSLDEEEEGCVWSRLYTIDPLNVRMRRVSQGFKYGGEIVFYDQGVFSCYDREKNTIKRLLGTTKTSYAIRCFSYEPTLFFIQGMKSVYLTTQARTPGCYRIPRRLMRSLRD